MKVQNSGRAASVCIAVLLAFVIVPSGCLLNGAARASGSTLQKEDGHSAGYCETCVAKAYGAFCVCDANGRTYDVCAACFVRKDGCADLYLLQDAANGIQLAAEGREMKSFVIDTVYWFVSERCANTEVLFKRIPVRAIYEQQGTLQTIGDDSMHARLIWAESWTAGNVFEKQLLRAREYCERRLDNSNHVSYH